MTHLDFGNFIYQRRKELGLSQKDIADFLFVSIPTISKWEKGERLPDLSIICDLATVLKLDLEDFANLNNKNICDDIDNSKFDIQRFASFFSYLRKRNNYTLMTLEKEIDVRYQTISKWEKGESTPNILVLKKCAYIFKVSFKELYYGKEIKKEVDIKKNKKKIIFIPFILIVCILSLLIPSLYYIIKNDNHNQISNNNSISKVESNKDFKYEINALGITILECLNKNKEVIIPNSIVYNNKEYEVTNISFGLLKDHKAIEKLVIPFVGESSLNNDNNHFGYIFGALDYHQNKNYVPASLKEVVINNAKSIEKYAFLDCNSIENITIPNSITYIGENAFEGCSSLKFNQYKNAYYLGNDNNPYLILIKAIDYSVLEVIINDLCKIIYSYAFNQFVDLISINIPQSIIYIGDKAFTNCRLLDKVYYDGTIESWCNIKFENYSSNPMYYHATSFYINNEEVKEIRIPDSITNLGNYQFDGFRNVNKIFIPDTVMTIGKNVFFGCDNITIYCEVPFKKEGWSDYWNNDKPVVWNYELE